VDSANKGDGQKSCLLRPGTNHIWPTPFLRRYRVC
jgi:hypothetical protein